MERLYLETLSRDKESFLEFSRKYGFYKQYEYSEGIIDISQKLWELLKCQ